MVVNRSLLLALTAALSLAACTKKPDTPTGDPTKSADAAGADSNKAVSSIALPVVGEAVRKGDLVLTVSATGQIRTDATSTLHSQADGTVSDVLVRAGDHVTAGQPLVKLDPKPLDLDLQAAMAANNNAQVSYRNIIEPDSIASGRAPTESRRAWARASAGVDNAAVQLEKAKLAREHAVITAPYEGVIEKVDVAKGDRVASGGEVATIVDLSNLRVEAQVLEHDLPLLRKGGEAYMTVAALPDKTYHGTIEAILPLIDSTTRSGRAVIRLKGDGMLRPGMYADIRLEANRLPNRIIVPRRAIVERDGRPLVFVYKDGIAEWVYIQQGRSSTTETEILPDSASGIIPLKPGDIVLTENHLTLSHQAPVRLVAKKEADKP